MLPKLLLVAVVTATAYNQLQESRWKEARVRPERQRELAALVSRIEASRARYEAVARDTGVPFHVIAGLHNMECSGSFSKHLHEGSPLTGRTRWVPKGRPPTGKPPFKWEVSAADALAYDRMGSKNWADLGAALTAVEDYNGTGYRKYHPGVPTPYLYAGTTVYRRGKYVSDGRWSSTAVSSQLGVAAIWKELERRGGVKLPD